MDARYEKSDKAIRDALVRLMDGSEFSSISMAELAAEAGLSRSTLYAHYRNVEEVLERIVDDFVSDLSPLDAHLRFGGCAECAPRSKPFCVALREARDKLPFVRNPRFFALLLERIVERDGCAHDSMRVYRAAGLDEAQARAVFVFQMSGCYAVALSEVPAVEWQHVQQTLDAFVRGGLAALRGNARVGSAR